ncbi:MAG: DUF11 domain-containing protein [Planctomycetes bacterium]|nr:DUF11 domain-containing protein [Planctomycetota bacterium]
MKRLWMRLGLVAGILGVGGAGVLVAQRSGTTSEDPTAVTTTTEAPTASGELPRPIPISDNSYGSEDGSNLNSAAPTNVAIYSNELETDEVASSAKFVGPPASSYASSPASYSINDTDTDTTQDSPERPQSTPQSSYAPTSVYTSEYSTAESTESSPYASRYGDATDGVDGTGASLRSPQELAATESEDRFGGYGDGASKSAAPGRPAPPSESAPELVNGDSSESPLYQSPAPIASNDGTIEPPPLSRDEIPARSSYAPVELAPPAAQQPLLSNSSTIERPTASATYAPGGSTAALVPSPLTSDTPGDRDLEGIQSPKLTFEKQGPDEVSVGQAAPYKIFVQNVGNETAHGVVVTDRVPQGMKLVDASPDFDQTADGNMVWQLGDLEPGDQAQVSIELESIVEGVVGSTANVTFRAQASVRSISTKPELVVKHTGPEKVLIGDDVIFEITLSNPGSGATTGIVIEEDVPAGLAHVDGDRLEYEIGTLRPQEEKRVTLLLRADKAGMVNNLLRVKADAGIDVTDQATLEVIAPDLQVAIGGPRTRYLERKVTYDVAVSNPGTSTAYDVELVTLLPKGLKYVSADNKGSYDPRRHAVYWSLAELPAGDRGSVQLTALPIETGEQKLLAEGTASQNLAAESEHTTNVQALTELAFSVQDVHDPIEVGSETMYEIRIVNNGNKVATNVQIAAAMPDQLTPISGDGPTKVIVEGQNVFMEPLARIAPRDEVIYRIAARGIGAGDHVIAVQLASDDVTTPVTKQESTKVYADE